jgi:hypothetical protein
VRPALPLLCSAGIGRRFLVHRFNAMLQPLAGLNRRWSAPVRTRWTADLPEAAYRGGRRVWHRAVDPLQANQGRCQASYPWAWLSRGTMEIGSLNLWVDHQFPALTSSGAPNHEPRYLSETAIALEELGDDIPRDRTFSYRGVVDEIGQTVQRRRVAPCGNASSPMRILSASCISPPLTSKSMQMRYCRSAYQLLLIDCTGVLDDADFRLQHLIAPPVPVAPKTTRI